MNYTRPTPRKEIAMINEAKERALISANEIANKLFPIPEQFLERKNFREGFAKGWLARTRQAAEDAEKMRTIVEELVAWNVKYPASRIYNETAIRKIAKEMDELFQKAKQALPPPPAAQEGWVS